MVITRQLLRRYEHDHVRLLPKDLKRYLLVNYAEEPFPYEYSQQDLDEHIRQAIQAYENGTLDMTLRTPAESWQEECELLRHQYGEARRLARDLADYVTGLEQWLHQHALDLPPGTRAPRERHRNDD